MALQSGGHMIDGCGRDYREMGITNSYIVYMAYLITSLLHNLILQFVYEICVVKLCIERGSFILSVKLT